MDFVNAVIDMVISFCFPTKIKKPKAIDDDSYESTSDISSIASYKKVEIHVSKR